MKKFIFFLFLATLSFQAMGQYTTCDVALYQLQSYAGQVQAQYNQNLAWIQYNVHPYYQQQYYAGLVNWYNQQSNYCNQWYNQIMAQCSGGQVQRVPQTSNGRGPSGQIASTRISEADAGRDVRISIPDNPVGWQH